MAFQRQTFRPRLLVLVSALFVTLVCFDVPLSADKAKHPDGAPSKDGTPAGANAANALARLKAGNARFVVDDLASRPTYPDQRRRLAHGQKPFAVVLTCADSRVVPELIFNRELGELFVIRVAGNVTDAVVLGSIEYAAEHLHCPLVVVLGHQRCGAVKAAIDGGRLEGNLSDLIGRVHIGPDRKTLLAETQGVEEAVEVAVRRNVRYQAHELSAKSDVLKKLVADNRLQVAGAVYSLETGRVEWLQASAEPRAAKGKP